MRTFFSLLPYLERHGDKKVFRFYQHLAMAEKVKTILITQQDPGAEKNPYVELAKKHKLKIDYRPFIHVEGVPSLDFRQQRVDILEHSGVIFTNQGFSP